MKKYHLYDVKDDAVIYSSRSHKKAEEVLNQFAGSYVITDSKRLKKYRNVKKLISEGFTNKEIAVKLGIKESSIRPYN